MLAKCVQAPHVCLFSSEHSVFGGPCNSNYASDTIDTSSLFGGTVFTECRVKLVYVNWKLNAKQMLRSIVFPLNKLH